MQVKRRLMMAGATLSIALAAGYVVQDTPAPMVASMMEPADPMPVNVVTLAATNDPAQALPPPADLRPALPAAADAPVIAAPASLPPPTALTLDCTPRLEIAAAPGALIGFAMIAPCHPGERVVIRHAGLAVTARTSSTGALFGTMPALTSDASLSVLFAGGETVQAAMDLPEADQFRRVAVQWMGEDTFQVHAFENGAAYGMPGHISAAAPGAPSESLTPAAGFMTLLGDAAVDTPMQAQVYSFPAAGSVAAVLETTVTAATCGREIIGESVVANLGQIEVTDLSVEMPDCSAIGEFLVLKNLAPDMKLAAAH